MFPLIPALILLLLQGSVKSDPGFVARYPVDQFTYSDSDARWAATHAFCAYILSATEPMEAIHVAPASSNAQEPTCASVAVFSDLWTGRQAPVISNCRTRDGPA